MTNSDETVNNLIEKIENYLAQCAPHVAQREGAQLLQQCRDALKSQDRKCKWVRVFDNHFNISCCDETGERANGNFKGKDKGATWEFKFCPYCGDEINEATTTPEGE